MPTDIYLLGAGIRGTLHFTQETLQAISACRVVFVLHNDATVLDYVAARGVDVRDVAQMYDGHTQRKDVYHAISEAIVAEAKNGPGVAFLVHGHPLLLVSATEYTLQRADEESLSVQMLPGVSSFDTLLCDLKIDYGYALQMFDSSTLVNRRIVPNPSVPLLVFQLSTTLSTVVMRDNPDATVLQPLVDHLLETYPSDHAVTVVHSSATAYEPSTLTTVELEYLAKSEIDLAYRPTLYVPPVC